MLKRWTNTVGFAAIFFIGLFAAIPALVDAAEGRIPISGPTTITAPGSYILTEDLVVANTAITVNADYVSIDMDGHSIIATAAAADVITNANNHRGISISNGKIAGGGFQIKFVATGGGEFTISNMTLVPNGANKGKGIYIEGGLAASNIGARVIIADTTIIDSNADGIFLLNADNGRITQTTIRGASLKGMQLDGASNNVISRNSLTYNGGGGLYMLAGSNNNLVAENTISDNLSAPGITLTGGCFNNILDRNTVAKNSGGIALTGSYENTLSYNNVSGNVVSGITLVNSSYNNISQNTSNSSTTLHGIHLWGTGASFSSYNAIDGNVLTHNGNDGTDCGLTLAVQTNLNVYRNNYLLNNGWVGCVNPGPNFCGVCDQGIGNVNSGGNVILN